MDFAEAWSTASTKTKTARRVSAERINYVTDGARQVVDALSPVCVSLAARWDAEAKRRDDLRTPENLKALLTAQREWNSARVQTSTARAQLRLARANSTTPFSSISRSAKRAKRAADREAKAKRTRVNSAKKSYPDTLARVAVKAHAAHVVPAGIASWLLSTAEHWTVWPGSLSAGLVALNAGALWLGRRTVTVPVDDTLTAEEQRLVARLDPSFWGKHAEERGLSGTVPSPVQITQAGLVSQVRLDGRWTPRSFAAKADEIRALIGARTELRMEITSGSHGDRATIVLRTRSAADGLDLKGWKPGDEWAVDTVTGESVPVPLGKRILVAGTSGSGKSTSVRPLMAEASDRVDHRLVIFDRKYVEGRTWEHRARVACELDDMRTVVDELTEEGEERLKSLPRGEDTVQISPERPRITVFVDEGGELLSDCDAKYKDEDGKNADYNDVIAGLRTIARKYRAAEIIVVWATQKPTLSGDGHGLDSQIAGQLTIRLALAVATSTETQAVFGPDAIEKGWKAHELPMPWVALMRDQDKGPKQRTNPIRMRWMTAQQVIELPARPIWHRGAAVPAAPVHRVEPAAEPAVARPTLTLLKGDASDAVPAPRDAESEPVALSASEQAVLTEIRKGGPVRQADVVANTGLAKGTVSKAVKSLIEKGAVRRVESGELLGVSA